MTSFFHHKAVRFFSDRNHTFLSFETLLPLDLKSDEHPLTLVNKILSSINLEQEIWTRGFEKRFAWQSNSVTTVHFSRWESGTTWCCMLELIKMLVLTTYNAAHPLHEIKMCFFEHSTFPPEQSRFPPQMFDHSSRTIEVSTPNVWPFISNKRSFLLIFDLSYRTIDNSLHENF
jgi:hypothetical protein